MRECRLVGRFSLAVFLCLTAFCAGVYAQGKADDDFLKKGIYQFRQENYDEALEIFKQVTKNQPKSSLAAYYLGLTYKRLENYVEAKKHLEDSLSMTPKIKGALIELIDTLYRLDEFDEAKKWIRIAEDEGIRPAQAKFLKGLTLQKSGEYEEAVGAFEDAKDLDDQLAQSANYQIGICYLKMKRFRDAKDVFQETSTIDPYSNIAEYANKYVDALERKLERERPFHFSTKFAFEYDSNVVLQPTDSSLITEVADKDDTRQVFDLKGDYTFRTEDRFLSLKTGYGFHLAKQNDLGRYDIIGNNVFAQGNVSFKKILVTFPVSYSHTIVDEKNYLGSFNAGNVNNFMLGKSQMGQLGAVYRYDDYMREPSISAEDRTGNELIGIAGWFWFFADNQGFINLRYNIDRDWAEGDNWAYLGHKIGAGILYPFWDRFKLSVNGEVFFQNFDNTHTIFHRKRRDQVYSVGSLLSYEILKNMELQVRYTYINEQSNLSIYAYDRYIISTGVQYKF